jgi:hypothetical protein
MSANESRHGKRDPIGSAEASAAAARWVVIAAHGSAVRRYRRRTIRARLLLTRLARG